MMYNLNQLDLAVADFYRPLIANLNNTNLLVCAPVPSQELNQGVLWKSPGMDILASG